MTLNPYTFRAYDIRGVADEDFTDADVLLLGRGIGTFLRRRGSRSVAVGRDDRLSSPRISQSLTRGLVASGLDVFDVGRTLTPALYFAVRHLSAGGGVMVTGSHNPPDRNGFKVVGSKLAPIHGGHLRGVRELIEQRDFEAGSGGVREERVLDAYVAELRSQLRFGRRLKVVVDAADGMAGLLMPELWESLGHEVTCCNCEPNGALPSHTSDTMLPAFYDVLRERVPMSGADVGIGYDGDADRFAAVDSRGRVVDTDRLIALLARDVLKGEPGARIMFDVRCSQVLAEVVSRAGGMPVLSQVGHSLIKEKMGEVGAAFAGELSGHVMYRDFFGIDDGIYASGRLLKLLSEREETLAELDDALPRYVSSREVVVHAPDDEKFSIVRSLTDFFKRGHEVVDIDGARVSFGNGWGLVRASNTAPEIKLRFEADTREHLLEIASIFMAKLREHPKVSFSEEDLTIS